ncbi:hypothetical protein G5C60_03210 [Streptomyces sp. HC44]|uniref:Regulatory protein n=1 Tax=Streptomyces scabichelini TaxID=2711217 RepID=A0A6G4UYF9_9ACTN|nr:hypothetical protein [Streptomyces scabichelini]NGO06700.1 hypothetical protein [Streptomyces scabichelini]
MTESTPTTTELTSQYMAQVASDLERNSKEQERIGAEIGALQEQLLALQHDHTVLVNMQQALGAGALVQPAPEDATAHPIPRQKATTEPGTGKQSRAKKATTAQGDKTAKKSAPKKPAPTKPAAKKPAADKAEATKAAQPTLVELIRRHLTQQSEPRSAAEIATALDQAHPDRRIKTTVVRTTLEGLVAKSHAHRTKQGSSVFYTTPEAKETTAPPQTETQPEQADH